MAIDATAHPGALSAHQLVADGWLTRYGNPHTRAGYTRSITQWFTWCEDHGIDPLAADRLHIEAWTRTLEEHGAKRSTVATKLHALASFYRYADIDDLLAGRNPMPHVRIPKVPYESTTNGLTRTQLADILHLAEHDRPAVFALICLLGLNGLRVSEAVGIQISDVGMTGYHRTFRVLRKGGKIQTLPMAPITAHAVELAVAGRTDGPVLLNRRGTAGMTRQGARRVVERLARAAGVPQRVSPHSFRHAFVTLSLDAGVTDRDIMASTGHTSSAMVAYYDRARERLDRNATWALTSFVRGAA